METRYRRVEECPFAWAEIIPSVLKGNNRISTLTTILLADISKAATRLGYQPTHRIGEGLKVAMGWYVQHLTQQGKA